MKTKIIQIISEIKNDDSLLSKINDKTDLINDIGLDSLQMINFLLKLEDEFNFELEFDSLDYEHLRVFENLVEFINKFSEEKV